MKSAERKVGAAKVIGKYTTGNAVYWFFPQDEEGKLVRLYGEYGPLCMETRQMPFASCDIETPEGERKPVCVRFFPNIDGQIFPPNYQPPPLPRATAIRVLKEKIRKNYPIQV